MGETKLNAYLQGIPQVLDHAASATAAKIATLLAQMLGATS